MIVLQCSSYLKCFLFSFKTTRSSLKKEWKQLAFGTAYLLTFLILERRHSWINKRLTRSSCKHEKVKNSHEIPQILNTFSILDLFCFKLKPTILKSENVCMLEWSSDKKRRSGGLCWAKLQIHPFVLSVVWGLSRLSLEAVLLPAPTMIVFSPNMTQRSSMTITHTQTSVCIIYWHYVQQTYISNNRNLTNLRLNVTFSGNIFYKSDIHRNVGTMWIFQHWTQKWEEAVRRTHTRSSLSASFTQTLRFYMQICWTQA